MIADGFPEFRGGTAEPDLAVIQIPVMHQASTPTCEQRSPRDN